MDKELRASLQIPPSKSLYNRALIVQSFYPDLKIETQARGIHNQGELFCQDILDMKNVLSPLNNDGDLSQDFFCGEGGTVLRFLVSRLSRRPGDYNITGRPRLLSRPHKELKSILSQLGVSYRSYGGGINIMSSGWKKPKGNFLHVDLSRSSQFVSGVLLSSWELDFDLRLRWESDVVSYGYLKMTIEFLREMGMEISEESSGLIIAGGQVLNKSSYCVEGDMSSAWTVAALSALSGQIELEGLTLNSLQPDRVFIQILKKMNVNIEWEKKSLFIDKVKKIKPISFNLKNSPDLFPVLCILCSFADGESHLYGATHLKYKESSRIDRMHELLNLIGIDCQKLDDGMLIRGVGLQRSARVSDKRYIFDCDHDHRLVMAVGILKKIGYQIDWQGQEAINKSFPGFLSLVGEE